MAELPNELANESANPNLSALDGVSFPLHLLMPVDVMGGTDREPDIDECYIREREPDRPALPPDSYSWDGVLRKGLGRLTAGELMDRMRERWASLDDEHQRSLTDHGLHARIGLLVSDEPESDLI